MAGPSDRGDQGGLLLAQTARATRPLEIALDLALDGILACPEPAS